MRYSYTTTKENEKGSKITGTTLLNRIKKRDTDIYIIIKERMRLDHLANQFYENASYWWIIASANSIGGKMFVEPGTSIRIPRNVSEIISDHQKTNSD
nr:hypothetical protein [uncultured Mediterranean phage uvMED]